MCYQLASCERALMLLARLQRRQRLVTLDSVTKILLILSNERNDVRSDTGAWQHQVQRLTLQ
eukprot:5064387-Pleurochrysis_carterae.AAC.1